MGWEQRGGRKYFYRSRRVDGQPRRIYLGSGPLGQAHELLFAEERRRREVARLSWQAELARHAAASARLDDLGAVADLLSRATLLVGGYHEHRGEWRRPHDTIHDSRRAGRGPGL